MRKLVFLIILAPLAIVLIALSVANRHPVTFSLDPINSEIPFLAVELPFFVYLFLALLLGMILGGLLTWFSQGKHRKTARKERAHALKLEQEVEEIREQANTAAVNNLPALSA